MVDASNHFHAPHPLALALFGQQPSTWDIIDERSGVLSAMVEALDRAELLDPHLLAPRRRVLKRPAAQIPRDSFKGSARLSIRFERASSWSETR